MKFISARLKNFRNIPSLEIAFNSGLNLFLGENGQGKTNLLEALYLSINGKSFRPSSTDNFIGFSEPQIVFVQTEIEQKNLESRLETKIENSRKGHFLNGKRVSGTYLLKSFPCVLFSPESLSAIKSGPEQRRELIDELLITFNLDNAAKINDFKKCLRSRNKILKSFLKGEVNKEQTELMLDSMEKTFLDLSVEITVLRLEALYGIFEDLNKAASYISDNENQKIDINYLISEEDSLHKSEEEIRQSLVARLRQLKGAELASGNSLVGPHKHDIRFLFNGNDSRYYCSQGQQRSLILAFKLAQILYHYRIHSNPPVLMLDDVLSELDLNKRKKLIDFLKDLKTQIFVTTTDISSVDFFLNESVSIFSVKNGEIMKGESKYV